MLNRNREKIRDRELERGESCGVLGQGNIPFPLTSISPDLVKKETFPDVTTMSAGGGESTKPNYRPFLLNYSLSRPSSCD